MSEERKVKDFPLFTLHFTLYLEVRSFIYATYPEPCDKQMASGLKFLFWSCSGWGLPCLRCCHRSGRLLTSAPTFVGARPRLACPALSARMAGGCLFTLTGKRKRKIGTVPFFPPFFPAVFFLWHFPFPAFCRDP